MLDRSPCVALQKYNADYDLSAAQGADTLAFVSLLEEKLLPVLVSSVLRDQTSGSGAAGAGMTVPGSAMVTLLLPQPLGVSGVLSACVSSAGARLQPHHSLGTGCSSLQIHTFWVDAKNYVEHTRKWYAETIPFPLNFFLPNCMHKQHLERLQLLWGDGYMEDEEKLEKEVRGCALGTAAPHGLQGSPWLSAPVLLPMSHCVAGGVTALSPPAPAPAVPGCSGMSDAPVPAPRIPEVFLWRLVGGCRGRMLHTHTHTQRGPTPWSTGDPQPMRVTLGSGRLPWQQEMPPAPSLVGASSGVG